MRGVSLEEISSATRISTKFLTAIESGHWEQLPGGAFNRGFIRSASRYLGLDEDGMVAEYSLEANHGLSETAPVQAALRRAARRRRLIGALGLTVLVICLVFAGRFALSKFRTRNHAGQVPAVSSSSSGVGDPASIQISAAAPLDLVVRASAAVHLQVTADGKDAFDAELQSGSQKKFSARQMLQVTSQDSSAVRLELNGQPVPPFGVPGRPGSITLRAKDSRSPAGGVH